MTPDEAIDIIKHYIASSVCVSHRAEEGIFKVLEWLEGKADDGK